VATPPNAIVFGSGHIRMGQMVRAGLILNLLIAVIMTAYIHYILLPAWNMSPSLPDWAK
jgi:sodium-dependent dicarboxylate transporter 2/3/5